MYNVIKGSNFSVKELVEILSGLPQDYTISIMGVTENVHINIDTDNGYIILDEYDLNDY